jgi:hypothetical protein
MSNDRGQGRQDRACKTSGKQDEARLPDTTAVPSRINPVVAQIMPEVREKLAPFYSDIGRPSIDPELLRASYFIYSISKGASRQITCCHYRNATPLRIISRRNHSWPKITSPFSTASVKSRHRDTSNQCPLYPPKADIGTIPAEGARSPGPRLLRLGVMSIRVLTPGKSLRLSSTPSSFRLVSKIASMFCDER